MKSNHSGHKTKVRMKSFILFTMLLLLSSGGMAKEKTSQKKVISYVDTSLNGSQKYVLRVDGKPFYMTNVQVRFDKLRYRWNWDIALVKDYLSKLPHWDSTPFPFLSTGTRWSQVKIISTGQRWSFTSIWHGNIILKWKCFGLVRIAEDMCSG